MCARRTPRRSPVAQVLAQEHPDSAHGESIGAHVSGSTKARDYQVSATSVQGGQLHVASLGD